MIQALIGPVTGLLDKFIEDKDQKAALAHDVATMAAKHAHDAAMAQIDVNKTEAQHRSVWVAGWRPACGWLCAAAMGAHFVIFPTIAVIAASLGHEVTFPEFDMGSLMTVLLGMLGLGGLRSFEKSKGVTK